MGNNEKCYRCDKLATSKEHVPPLCLFPEQKDLGINLRKELITVPSCDEHNSSKSKDDEFLMVSIAGIVGNNSLGFLHTQTKINRALRRKSRDFLNKAVMRNLKSTIIKTSEGKEFPIVYGNPDSQRLKECFKSIAYGLFYHENKKSFQGQIKILLGFLQYEDLNHQTFFKFLKRRFDLEELALDKKGKNPSVFQYQFCKPDEFGIIGMRLTFYSGTEVFIAFQPEGSSTPSNLGIKLMNSGIPTTLTLGDEEFHFNQK